MSMMNQVQERTSKNLNFLRKTTRKQCPVLIEPPVVVCGVDRVVEMGASVVQVGGLAGGGEWC